MTDETPRKPILCLDFDGVLHSYTSGWQGADVIPDPPVEGAIEFLPFAAGRFEVHIFSSRSHQPGGIEAMREWLLHHGRERTKVTAKPALVDRKIANWEDFVRDRLHFPTEKPPALITIDDRVHLFTGTWPTLEELLNFKPWNKQ